MQPCHPLVEDLYGVVTTASDLGDVTLAAQALVTLCGVLQKSAAGLAEAVLCGQEALARLVDHRLTVLPGPQMVLASAHGHLGVAYHTLKEKDQSLDQFLSCVAIRRALLAPDPAKFRWEDSVANPPLESAITNAAVRLCDDMCLA